jgi:lipopolysaccharide export system protein LptA
MKLTALLLFLAVSLSVRAAEPTPLTGMPETHISSDSVEFDMKTRVATYQGNVRVADPRITITCDFLTARVPESGRVDSIVAETNVVAVIATNNTVFTVNAAKAIYTYQVLPFTTNQTLELTGLPAPRVTWPQEDNTPPKTNEFFARRILWDLGRNTFKADEHRGVFPDMEALKKRVKSPDTAASTNAPAAKP